MSAETPLMRQYNDIKRKHPGSILFFRMGDFYEMFGDDAVVASKALEITLTTRGKDKDGKIPLCGVPYHAADNYIDRLIKKGFKVAVCEQVEDPKNAKGIVKREVIRVITPGTLLEDNLLTANENNFLAAVTFARGKAGVAFADISTGELYVAEVDGADEDALMSELARTEPKEVLIPGRADEDERYAELVQEYRDRLARADDWSFDPENGRRKMLDHFGVGTLEGYGVEGMDAGLGACGAVFGYLMETHPSALLGITRVRARNLGSYMVLDESTRFNLELTWSLSGREGTLINCLDETVTSMGARRLKGWVMRPLLELDDIRARHAAVEELSEGYEMRGSLRDSLKGVHDLERLTGRVTSGVAGPRDLASLKASLDMVPLVKSGLAGAVSERLRHLADSLGEHEELRRLIGAALPESPPPTLKDGGVIRDGYDAELDGLRMLRSEGKGVIAAIERDERAETGIDSLKVRYNRVFGYYIEISRANLAKVPKSYIRKQTLVNAERFITPRLKEYEEKVLGAEERILELESRLFAELRDKAASHAADVQTSAGALSEIDALGSFAEIAVSRGYARPVMDDSGELDIRDGRHPVIETLPGMERFIPNDTFLDREDNRLVIITGPNMAGKSTYMRQVALIVLMAQTGSFVPARSARIGVVDRIFTRVGASDNIARGQSTFMVEMNETANILNNATKNSLIILDEIGRGTSTFDGLSIAWAVAEYIHDKARLGAKTLFATHYHELTELASAYPGIQNRNIAVREYKDEIIFLRKIVEGGADKSYGIQVARLAGLPGELLDRAKEILGNLERSEYDEAGLPTLARPVEEAGPGQLDIFQAARFDPVADELIGLDVMNMTPLEAMQKLEDLKRHAQRLKGRP